MRRSLLLGLVLALLLSVSVVGPAAALSAEIWFPVQITEDVVHHTNYGDCRSGCSRTHRGNDIMAPQMTPVYAAESGYIRRAYGGDSRECLDGGVCSSYGFLIYGDDGNSYFYLHLNDDTPGRPSGCDHRGGAENAFSPRLVDVLRERGSLEPRPHSWSSSDVVRVQEGELIGYVGSSGNAGCRSDHLHFEMWEGHDFLGADDARKTDPAPYLQAARDAGRYHGPDERSESGARGSTRDDAAAKPAPDPRARVAGKNRVLTSVGLSQAAFETSRTVVIAPAEVYPEALVAAPLAATMDAPVLLTWNHQTSERDLLDPAVAAEIDRLGATYAVIVGSPDRLGSELEDQLVARTDLEQDDVRRISGAGRWELSRRVAEHISAYHGSASTSTSTSAALPFRRSAASTSDGPISPLLALGHHDVPERGWPDALSASVLAARQTVPILLTEADTLPEATRAFLSQEGIGEVRIVGGTAAISAAVEEEIRELGLETRRLSGRTRFETSLAIAAETVTDGASPSRVWVATGHNYPDALASGQAVAALGDVLVLVDGRDPAGADGVYAWLREHAEHADRVYAIGGPAVVTDDVLRELAVHANWPR